MVKTRELRPVVTVIKILVVIILTVIILVGK